MVTIRRDSEGRAAPDLVGRDLRAAGPHQLWAADITYVPTWAAFLCLAVVVDAWRSRVVGWSMADNLRTQLVINALTMALEQRRPSNVIHHSDHGCQYTSITSGKRCTEMNVRPSMGRSAPATTTRSARASSPPASASRTIARPSAPVEKLAERSSPSSRGGTTPTVVTPPSTKPPPWTSKGGASSVRPPRAAASPQKVSNFTPPPPHPFE